MRSRCGRASGSTATYDIWAGSGDESVRRRSASSRSTPTGTCRSRLARRSRGRPGPRAAPRRRCSTSSCATPRSQAGRWCRTIGPRAPTAGHRRGETRARTISRSGSGMPGRRHPDDVWRGTAQFEVMAASLQLTTTTLFPSSPAAAVVWKAEVPDATLSLDTRSTSLTWPPARGGWRRATARATPSPGRPAPPGRTCCRPGRGAPGRRPRPTSARGDDSLRRLATPARR